MIQKYACHRKTASFIYTLLGVCYSVILIFINKFVSLSMCFTTGTVTGPPSFDMWRTNHSFSAIQTAAL